MTMPLLFRDIPQFTRGSRYSVHIGWEYLATNYYHHVVDYGLDVNPSFQRAHVWTLDQKVRYVEYALRGGTSGMDLYFNCPTWSTGKFGPEYPNAWYVLVDGKQRMDAVLGFMSNEFPVFGGSYRRDYSDKVHDISIRFTWNVNDLATISEVYQWYIDLNTGGTAHTESEITKVRDLLSAKVPYTKITGDEAKVAARLNCEAVQKAKTRLEANAIKDAQDREEARMAREEARMAREAATEQKKASAVAKRAATRKQKTGG